MRLLSSLASLALHSGIVLYLLFGPDVFPTEMHETEVYMVELAKAPEPIEKPAPKIEPQPPEPEPSPAPDPAPQSAPRPLDQAPPPEPEQQPEQAAAQQTAQAEPLPQLPAPEPGVIQISPKKRPVVPRKFQPSATPNASLTNTIVLRNEDKDGLKRGAELRFALRTMAADDFDMNDYTGHYLIGNSGRFFSVMDRGDGSMLIFDSKTGLLRTLARKGAMIYTYGPRAGVNEPVVGSVTFFPVKHKEAFQDSEKPGHLMWMPESPPVMHWATRMRFEERTIRLRGTRATGRSDLSADLILPVGSGPWPGLVWVGGPQCDDTPLLRSTARMLASRGIAVLLTRHRSCGSDVRTSTAEAAGDVLNALRAMRRQPLVDAARTGLWGHGAGSNIALAAAARADDLAFAIFDVLAAQGAQQPENTFDPSELGRVGAPSIWLLQGAQPATQFAPLLQALDAAASKGSPVERRQIAIPASGSSADWLAAASVPCLEAALPWLGQHVSGL